MKRILLSVLIAVGLALGAGAAQARPLPANGMTLEEIASWLQSAGYKAEIQTNNHGERNIYSSSDGINWHIYQYDCKNGRCGSLQFAIGVDTHGSVTAEKMNEWNTKNRWVRSYMDNVNDPWLEYDVDLTPGGTYELLNDEFAIWRDALRRFRTFINF